MAEACTRRPQIVEEELKEAATAIPTKKINVYSVFLDTLGSWYRHLKPEDKAKLTTKRFKRRVVVILERFRYPYSSLPKDWVATAVQRFGIRFYEKIKKPKVSPAIAPDVEVKFKLDPMNVMPGLPATLEGVAAKGKIMDSSVKMEIDEDEDDKDDDIKTDGTHQEGAMPPASARRKKFVDLTDLPPPVEWASAHAAGIYLPRELVIYSGDTQNVLFYDYSPKSKCENDDCGGDPSKCRWKGQVHDRNNFSWINSEFSKIIEADDNERIQHNMEMLKHSSQNAVESVSGDDSVVSPPIQIPSAETSSNEEDYESEEDCIVPVSSLTTTPTTTLLAKATLPAEKPENEQVEVEAAAPAQV